MTRLSFLLWPVAADRSSGLVLTGPERIGYKVGPAQEGALIASSGDSVTHNPYGAPWTVRGLVASHRRASLLIAGLCVLAVAYFTLIALGPRAGAVTDRTTCEQWASTNVDGQVAYARLYVSEHGNVSPRWGPAPRGVINAINAGCYQAYGEDVANTATVVQAISRNF